MVFDLETTGINQETDAIIEISAVKVRNHEVIEEFSTLVNPGRRIPKAATAVNGITDDIVDQLVAYRKKLKLTQQDIADATGIKRANIARLELKKNEASLDSLVRYAKSMELDLSIELVGMKEVS